MLTSIDVKFIFESENRGNKQKNTFCSQMKFIPSSEAQLGAARRVGKMFVVKSLL